MCDMELHLQIKYSLLRGDGLEERGEHGKIKMCDKNVKIQIFRIKI